MNEAAADGTRTGVQILVVAPDSEVGAAVVQLDRHVADRMSQIEADATSCSVRRLRDRAQVEALAVEELHTGQHHGRELRTLALDERQHVFGAHGFLAGTRPDFEHRSVRSESVQLYMRCDGVAVRRERILFDEDLRAFASWAVEGREHQVQVHRQRVHRDDFERLCTDQPRQRRRETLVIGQPRPLRFEVTVDGALRPAVQLLLNDARDRLRLQSE
jgi:hypothetical protein